MRGFENLLELDVKIKKEARIVKAALLTDVELLVTYNLRYTQGFNYTWPKFLFDYFVIKARDPASPNLFS